MVSSQGSTVSSIAETLPDHTWQGLLTPSIAEDIPPCLQKKKGIAQLEPLDMQFYLFGPLWHVSEEIMLKCFRDK